MLFRSNGSIFLKVSRPSSGFPSISIPVASEQPTVDTSIPQAAAKPPKPAKAASTTDNLIFDFNDTPSQPKSTNASFEPLLPEDDLLGMSSSGSSVPKQVFVFDYLLCLMPNLISVQFFP